MTARTGRHGWRARALDADRRRRGTAFGILALALLCVLGIGIATQVRETSTSDNLENSRPEDLLVVLDTLTRREASIRDEISTLQATLATLRQSGSGSEAAVAEAQERLSALSIQVGTVAAQGPGVTLVVDDPNSGVGSEVLLDAMQELRAAGAEALQIEGGGSAVRIGVDSWIAGPAGRVVVDGRELRAPYTFTAIGDSPTLASALNIPGGVVDTVTRNGASSNITQSDQVTVSALRDPRPRQYAQPGN
ncbi:DUF881 domain-containing protein [Rhodococcus sp. 06-412-2C]|uniref:DUF881 domain-containing protein n=1 Tax=Nocardiaceae TaxID=85025 RepID=UPI00050CEFDE|nr:MULTISPECIES: DUF881 domain-containing protein [Rhodococcus]OZC81787.1 DUF881 domain-containing protein [Rhodococcus sp. 06-412-2C]OZC95986.1 DUF881 domain-containing protein [Rhodococcus sp. 06-412-2B]